MFLLVGTAVFVLVPVVARVMPRPKVQTGPTEIELLTQIRDELRSFD